MKQQKNKDDPLNFDQNNSNIEEFSENDEHIGKEFLIEIQNDPQNIKQLLEEFINISYRYEKDVKDTKALYEWLIEILPQAIWVYNSDGSFFYRNALAIRLSEIVDFIDPNNLMNEQEVEYKKNTYLVQTNIFQNRRLITATNITAQKRQERLASMGQISAHLAHEIRNPIASISLLAHTLLKKVDDLQKPIIAELQKSIFRVERIIKATLLFSKGISLNIQPIRVSDLKEDLYDSLKSYSYSKQIRFDFEFINKVAYIDRDLVAIALQNFLFNSIDAIEESEINSGYISIRSHFEQDEIVFKVMDNGKPFEDPNILFEPFATTKLKGNGLGLALSLQIIYAHHGRIILNTANKEFSVYIKRFKK